MHCNNAPERVMATQSQFVLIIYACFPMYSEMDCDRIILWLYVLMRHSSYVTYKYCWDQQLNYISLIKLVFCWRCPDADIIAGFFFKFICVYIFYTNMF